MPSYRSEGSMWSISGKSDLKPALKALKDRLMTKNVMILEVTADHGNAENMVQRNKSGQPLLDKISNIQILTSHTLQTVKKYKHDSLKLHGAGKHLAKDNASRIMNHLVIVDILVEDVKKGDLNGSVSSS